MPAQIGYEQRRRDLAEVAARLIAERGMEMLTIRDVAAAAGKGLSTSVVSHYFRSKRELLLHVYRFVGERARSTARPEGGWTPETLRADIERRLPFTEQGRESFAIWLAFWGIAAADKEFAREQAEQMRLMRDEMEQRFREAFDVSPPVAAHLARRCLALSWGLAVEILFDAPADNEDHGKMMVIRELIESMFRPASER